MKRLPSIPSKKNSVSAEEWEARLELAAVYRLLAHHKMTHLINSHVTLRVPGTEDQLLINPYGPLFEQITASSLVKIDTDGNPLEETPHGINHAGFVIHGAIHLGRPDPHCVIHTHTVAGMAVSSLDCGILPLNQGAMRFYNRIGYHDHEGISHDLDERARLVRDLGSNKAMILKNHGLIVGGVNAAEAFYLIYHLEKTCEAQLRVLSSNTPYSVAPPEVCEKTAQQFYKGNRPLGQREWPALMDLVEECYPNYAH